MITLADIANFIVYNRKGKAYYNWSYHEIIDHITDCAHKHTIVVVSDKNGVCSVASGNLIHGKMTVHVAGIINTKPGGMRALITRFRELFPNIDRIQGYRDSELRTYPVNTLAKLLH